MNGQQYVAETFRASADFTGKIHHLVAVVSGTSTVRLASSASAATGANTAVWGILMNECKSGEAASVIMFGKAQVYAGGSFAAGQPLTTDANGKAVAAASGDLAIAEAMGTAIPDVLVHVMAKRPWRVIGP